MISSQDNIKAGIVGFGKRGILHASLVNINPKAEWMAVCDTNEQLLSFMKNIYPNVSFFQDADEMLEKTSINTVFICTPDNTHLSLATKLIKKNMNIFVENPLADSFSSSKQMVSLISQASNAYSVGYYSSFKMLFQQARTLFDNGILDRVKRFQASMFYSLPQGSERKAGSPGSQRSGRTITYTASSFLYLINWLFGPVKNLYAKASSKLTEIKGGLSIILEYSSGLQGLLDLSWSHPGYPIPFVKISAEGTGGTMEISDDDLKLYLYKKKAGYERGWTTIDTSDIPSPSRFFLCDEGYYEGNSSFINSCSDTKQSVVKWEDGLEIMRMIEAVHLSIDSKQIIFLEEVK